MEKADWQAVLELLKKAYQDHREEDMLTLLLTSDECETLATRVKIIEELLRGSINQRELKNQLGTGIATITRGSNSLKTLSPEFKEWLTRNICSSTK